MSEATTRDLARRYLKGQMRLAICEARLETLGSDDPVWSPLAWMAQGIAEEARVLWAAHAFGKSRQVLTPHILEAMPEAADEAIEPYLDVVDRTWLKHQVDDYLSRFNMEVMFPPEGSA